MRRWGRPCGLLAGAYCSWFAKAVCGCDRGRAGGGVLGKVLSFMIFSQGCLVCLLTVLKSTHRRTALYSPEGEVGLRANTVLNGWLLVGGVSTAMFCMRSVATLASTNSRSLAVNRLGFWCRCCGLFLKVFG